MVPNGVNSKRKASNNQNDYGATDIKVMIPGGWNSQREARNVQHNPGPVKDAMEEGSWWMDNSKGGQHYLT